jgi:hypothetical protein
VFEIGVMTEAERVLSREELFAKDKEKTERGS